METILFILGLPGSGKSSAARYVQKLAEHHGWTTQHFRDYDILYEMYQLDQRRGGKRFKPTEYDGFDVRYIPMFCKALEKLNSKVLGWVEEPDNNSKLCIIEFARDDYSEALKVFNKQLLFPDSTYFLFIDAEILACMKRIRARVAKPDAERTLDDHFVSEDIFDIYYQKDHREYLTSTASQLSGRFSIKRSHIRVVNNTGEVSQDAFQQEVEQIGLSILQPGNIAKEEETVLALS